MTSDKHTTSGNEKILLVDDDELLINVCAEILTEYGYQVTKETDSQKALQHFRDNPHTYDLVISDQTMPQLSGKELLKELLTIRPDLLTILCTGYSSKINEEEAIEMGIKAYCLKPLDTSELLQTTRMVLDKIPMFNSEAKNT